MRGDMLDGIGGENGIQGSAGNGYAPSPVQSTLKHAIPCAGVGLHSGQDIKMVLKPAPADHGVVFYRTDVTDRDPSIPAQFDYVSDTRLCSTISNADGVSVATIEHLMSALAGLSIDNVLIEIDGAEVPVMDGSAEPFVFLIECAGREEQVAPRKAIRILREVHVSAGESTASLLPSDGYAIDMAIDFDSGAIGRQWMRAEVQPDLFRRDISRARTFGFRHEVEAMRAMGLGLGGSLDNAVVVDGDTIMNEDGLRFDDEFIRHKILDCIGDLALAGHPLIGLVQAERTGHALNNKLLHALFADEANWEFVTLADFVPEEQTPALIAAE